MMVWLGAAAGGCGIKSAMRPPSLLKMPELPSTEATEGSGQAVGEQLMDKNAGAPQKAEQGEERKNPPDKQKRK